MVLQLALIVHLPQQMYETKRRQSGWVFSLLYGWVYRLLGIERYSTCDSTYERKS